VHLFTMTRLREWTIREVLRLARVMAEPYITQAVYHRLPPVVARDRPQVRSCMICDGRNGTGPSFLRVLRFHLQIIIPLTAPITRG
jgi:hypothetical protein